MRRGSVGAGLLLAACLALSVALVRRTDEQRAATARDEVLYLHSPALLRRLSLGHEGLVADLYWTRAVQYFGMRRHAREGTFPLLDPLLEIATALDPKLTVAYQFGASFLSPPPPDGAGQPEKAIELLEFGIRHNPEEWRLFYNLGFIYYLEMKDYARASEAFGRGAKVPGAHPFLRVLAAQTAEHAGEVETARLLWETTLESSTDPLVRENARTHLRGLQ